MGSNTNGTQCPTNTLDPDATTAEVPCHQVNVPEFWIDRTEVTAGDYRAYVTTVGEDCVNPGNGGSCVPPSNLSSYYDDDKMLHPMDMVDWYMAQGYCLWATKRLCSEAEWEKAARGTDGRLYPWGNDVPTCSYAVLNNGKKIRGCGTRSTFPVGSKPRGVSPYGLLDMAGNVDEWTQDLFHDNYQGAPYDGSAWETDGDYGNPTRGGSWEYTAPYLRSAFRGGAVGPLTSTGFRCCKTVGD